VRSARAAAVVTWVYAALFGLPALPIAVSEARTGELPWVWDWFQAFSGPWTVGTDPVVIAELLLGFFVLTLVASFSGWWLFRGQQRGAILNLSVMVAEMAFWFGFALVFPWVFGLARIGLIALAWRHLRTPHALQHG